LTPDVVLTVITPVLNGASHIGACLDSVRAQEQSAVEHLIVDGGSTDGTIDIVRTRAALDSRVRLIEGPDRGQSNAMNKGVVAARGPLLGILNVDDHYCPGAIALAIAHLARAPVPSFLWGACEVRDQLNGRVWIQHPGRLETWRMLLGWDFEPHPVNPAAYFYHRSLHFEVGLFDEEEHFAMDVDFLLRAALHVRTVITVPDLLGVFEMAPGTKTFEDIKTGTSRRRVSAVFEKIEQRLSIPDRLRLKRARLERRFARGYRARILGSEG